MSFKEVPSLTPDLFQRITTLFTSQKVKYRVIEHKEISDDSAAGSSMVAGTRPEQGAKALVMMIDELKPIIVVLRGPDRVDKGALKKIAGSEDIRLATLEEIQTVTHSDVGTLPPIGSLFNIPTYLDRRLIGEGEMAFGTGLRTKTIVMRVADFIQVAKPIIGIFTKKIK
jgi:Ala-tRNA(Pro) deacylase